MDLKKFVLKIARVIISMIIKLEEFDFDNILTDQKSYKNILTYNISNKIFIGALTLCIRFDKIDEFIRA